MKLYQLLFATSKCRKPKVLMISSREKCENYRKAREGSGNQSKAGRGFHTIEPAPEGANEYRRQSCTVRGDGNKTNCGPVRVGKGRSGWVGKHGFQENT